MTTSNSRRGLRGGALALLLLALCCATFAARAAEEVGRVSRIQGAASAVTEGEQRALRLLAAVHQDDVISTGAEARLEIALNDGTVLTLGENAQLTLDEFIYRAGGTANRFVLSVVGAFRFLSGKLADSPAHRARIRTPVVTLGVRGTDVWGGPIDRRYGVLLLEGVVEVTNAAGSVVLRTPGEGTNIAAPGTAPGAVTRWPGDKVARALATVSFR